MGEKEPAPCRFGRGALGAMRSSKLATGKMFRRPPGSLGKKKIDFKYRGKQAACTLQSRELISRSRGITSTIRPMIEREEDFTGKDLKGAFEQPTPRIL